MYFQGLRSCEFNVTSPARRTALTAERMEGRAHMEAMILTAEDAKDTKTAPASHQLSTIPPRKRLRRSMA